MKIELENLKEVILNLTIEDINYLYSISKNENEKIFYNNLFNLVLQTKQKELIDKGVF